MDVRLLGQADVLGGTLGDVARQRERSRRQRLGRVLAVLGPIAVYAWWRIVAGNPVHFGWPQISTSPEMRQYIPGMVLVALLGLVLVVPMLAAGKSPHASFRPNEIPVGFDDVVGIGVVKDEVIKTLNLFLAYRTFRERMGGNPRKAILFEGPPGTGKTHMAKAMAREAGVPFLFVSASAFQSMY
jgi:hypothetical protein